MESWWDDNKSEKADALTLPLTPFEPTSEMKRRKSSGIHRAWLVTAVTVLALVAAAAFRPTSGAFFEPLEAEFGWTRP